MLHPAHRAALAALLLTVEDGCFGGPSAPPVARVTVAVAPSTLSVGDSATLTVEALSASGGALNRRVAGHRAVSRDTSVAVTRGAQYGWVVARSPGATWIVAEARERRDSVRVTVIARP